jgi:hypothetical protein
MHAASTSNSAELDYLDLLQCAVIRVPCIACGQRYEVSLRRVLLSQEMMHDGCPVSVETECPPLFCAPLADENAVRDLERSWARLSELVRVRGLDLALRSWTR